MPYAAAAAPTNPSVAADVDTAAIEADFAILEAIGARVEAMVEKLLTTGAIQKTLRRWLVGHTEPTEDDDDALACLMAMASDLELFTPSATGRTMVEREIAAHPPRTTMDGLACAALRAARFRLVRILERLGPDLVALEDLATGERLVLLHAHISPLAADLTSGMRLCRLNSGRYVLISPRFAMDEKTLEEAMGFVRDGRLLGQGHRCAAAIYRTAARRGARPLPQIHGQLDLANLIEIVSETQRVLRPVEDLALRWIAKQEARSALILEARRLATIEDLVDACGCYGQMHTDGPKPLKAAFDEIVSVQVETLAQRARARVGAAARALDLVAEALADHIAQGRMHVTARDLFERHRRRWSAAEPPRPEKTEASASSDLERVLERIRALRAKTVDRGCTEAEAMAAAAKVSELLERYDLTLDEVSVRRSDCEGVSVATGRKRRAAVDTCMGPIAAFTDCRVWSEETDEGLINYVFFGLKVDVEAARFLRDLVEGTFATESAAFRCGAIYLELCTAHRRVAFNSFQLGLARGISTRLAELKAARARANVKSTGFDLVAVKSSVVDEEVGRLGLNFKQRSTKSRRYVHGDAYNAGRAVGSLFEPGFALPG